MSECDLLEVAVPDEGETIAAGRAGVSVKVADPMQ
jgi:hypothetical protein